MPPNELDSGDDPVPSENRLKCVAEKVQHMIRKPRNKHSKVQLVLGWKSVPGRAIAQKGNESFLREEEIVAFQAENAAAAKTRKQKQLRYTQKCRLSGEHMVG